MSDSSSISSETIYDEFNSPINHNTPATKKHVYELLSNVDLSIKKINQLTSRERNGGLYRLSLYLGKDIPKDTKDKIIKLIVESDCCTIPNVDVTNAVLKDTVQTSTSNTQKPAPIANPIDDQKNHIPLGDSIFSPIQSKIRATLDSMDSPKTPTFSSIQNKNKSPLTQITIANFAKSVENNNPQISIGSIPIVANKESQQKPTKKTTTTTAIPNLPPTRSRSSTFPAPKTNPPQSHINTSQSIKLQIPKPRKSNEGNHRLLQKTPNGIPE
ncbi:hypothetical protein DICPUDRAFT_160455 [Dictyostelium purpureum]|uniref:Uncharacterized protein n=1 Tax=Dictyostelium purpureum TaxID=5786 RepID=F1A6C8_DICPU|nr:uncharacterized protein DICPUDRAFT_160455 [Dictyostelium purpureum]EGC28252.1 hypothetical protein DICPUDRAFT_160455 [Dictyostelium purpureum]|eukprot:XP_003295222.1 hypothetical protein DICPUDRAFT_160455 [Dictyostelium purpureum]